MQAAAALNFATIPIWRDRSIPRRVKDISAAGFIGRIILINGFIKNGYAVCYLNAVKLTPFNYSLRA